MQIELTDHEGVYLKHLLDTARKSLLHELHHTHGLEFRDALRLQFELNEKLVQKLEPAPVAAR